MLGCRIGFLILMTVLVVGSGSADDMDILPLGDPERAYIEASAPVGSLFDCRTAEEISIDEMARRAGEARVVILGEQHTDWEQKLFHARFLEALAGQGGNVVLGLEFFHREHSDDLQRWRRGEVDTQELLRTTGWYDRGSIRFAFYENVMQVARRNAIPIVGLNVPREILRTVSTGGLEALGAEDKARIGEVPAADSPQHRYLFARYMGDTVAELPTKWFDNMYVAQCLWDVVMARSILDRMPTQGTLVAIVGSGHAAYGLGISRRIDEERDSKHEPRVPVMTFCPVAAPPPSDDDAGGHPMGHHHGQSDDEPRARFVRSLADVVGVFPSDGGLEKWPRVGIQLADSESGGVVVKRVWPDTFAEEMGLQIGDRLLKVNGADVGGVADLRFSLAGLEWGQRLAFEIRRGDERTEVAALLYPVLSSTEATTVPGWTTTVSQRLDPGSIAVARPSDPERMSEEKWTLAQHHGVGVRLEVRRGSLLTAVHELDSGGRVERSVFLEPLTDGAVEVVYRRDDDGRVTRSLRLDERGEAIR